MHASIAVDRSHNSGDLRLCLRIHPDILHDNHAGEWAGQAGNHHNSRSFLHPHSKFFPKILNAKMEFFRGPTGQVSHWVLHQDGHDMRGGRK